MQSTIMHKEKISFFPLLAKIEGSTYKNILGSVLLDPLAGLGPVSIQQQQTRLAAALDELIRLGHKLVGQQPGVVDLELVQGGADMLIKLGLVVQEGGVDRDVGQAGGGLDEFGSRV